MANLQNSIENLDSKIAYVYSYHVDGLSAAGLRVLLHPLNEEGLPGGFDRVLWSTKDPTNQKWMEAEVLYTYNKDHQVTIIMYFMCELLLSKNLKIIIYKTIILSVVLYGCEAWSLTLREECRLRVLENRIL